MKMKIVPEHVGIYAKDVEVMKNWYCDVLRLKIIRKVEKAGRPPIYFLASDEGGLVIEMLPTTSDRKERDLMDPGYSHIALEIDNFDEVESYLKSRGIELFGVRMTSVGWKIGYFKDPEGNILEIVQR